MLRPHNLHPRNLRAHNEVMTLPTAFLVGPQTCVEPDRPSLADQLTALGFTVVREVDDLAARIRSAPPGRVAILDRRIRAHQHALRRILVDPRGPVTAHPTGVIAVADEARAALATAVADSTISQRSALHIYVGHPGPPPRIDLGGVLASLESALPIRRVPLGPLVLTVVNNPTEEALVAHWMAEVDEEHVRFSTARGTGDGPMTSVAVRGWSMYVARWLAGRGLRPNQVTAAWCLLGLLAATLCVPGSRAAWIAAAVALAGSVILDHVDGDLARYTCLFTRRPEWLTLASRVREYALVAGLATGAAVTGTGTGIWLLGAAVLAIPTIGRQAGFAHTWSAPTVAAEPAQTPHSGVRSRLPAVQTGDRLAIASPLIAVSTPLVVLVALLILGVGGVVARVSTLLQPAPAGGATPSSGAAQAEPADETSAARADAAMAALLDVGPLGWLLGRLLPPRALIAPVGALAGLLPVVFVLPLVPTLGPGWLPAVLGWYSLLIAFSSRPPRSGGLDWLLPPTYRIAEYGIVIVLAGMVDSHVLVLAFGYVAMCAYHHDTIADRLADPELASSGRWLVAVSGGHEGRLLLLGAGWLAGSTTFVAGLALLTLALATLTTAGRVLSWRKRA